MALYSDDEEGGVIRGTRETPPSHYVFKVESFSLFAENGPEKLESKEFEAGELLWKIVFFPKGQGEGNADHISIYLSLAETDSAVDAVFRFFLFDQIRGKYLTVQGSIRRFDNVKYNWGFAKFVSLEAFEEPSSGYLVNDTCFIGVDVFVLKNVGVGKCIGECLSVSKAVNLSYKHRWMVTQFSKLEKEYCYSDEFVVGGYKWKLGLYPEASDQSRSCYLSLFLVASDFNSSTPADKVKVEYTLTLRDQINQKHEQQKTTFWFGGGKESWGWSPFIKLELKDIKRGFIIGDCCIFEAEVTVLCETKQKTL